MNHRMLSFVLAVALSLLPFSVFYAEASEPETTSTPSLQKTVNKDEIVNSLAMRLKLIPVGEFYMGSSEDDSKAQADEKPRHKVAITRPFYLSAHEVTRSQFAKFVTDSGYRAGERWRNPSFTQSDDHPVVEVSWNDATAFLNWLSKKEGTQYRLPTEAEWEYACRAGTTTKWSNGDDVVGLPKLANVDTDQGTMSVGSFQPNAFGLFDMHGNVWEWCQDWYSKNYYNESPHENPSGPPSGSQRVLRGGGWINPASLSRCASRSRNSLDNRNFVSGFRIARNP